MAFAALIVVPLYAWQTVPELLAGTDPTAEPKSPAPREAVDDAHTALHRIGAACGERPDLTGDISAEVTEILTFAERYPTGRFPIDDQTGTSLSLLLVVREALRDCDPRQADRVNGALPETFQRTPYPR
jgi:hypothetical protein